MRSSPSRPDPLAPGPAGFAHRGLHGHGVPENSLAAFRAAFDAGAGIECDVRLSRDDLPMIFHDPDLKRLCGESGSVETLSAATLSGKRLLATGEPIPRLADLMMLAARVERPAEGGKAVLGNTLSVESAMREPRWARRERVRL
jgi:glycerophosphoryl diester phosphodiesterase